MAAARWHVGPLPDPSSHVTDFAYKRGVTGSNPVAPTKFLQLDGLFEMLIGDPVTTVGNHRCMLPDWGTVPSGHGSMSFDDQGAPAAGTTGTGVAGLKDPL
jgi:hypothetical protein